METEQSFQNANVAFAIDVSSSTTGPVLEAEKRFIFDVSSTLSRSARQAVRILPWDEQAQPVIPLDALDKLKVGFGTTPAVIMENDQHRGALKHASVWFLITDGMIAASDLEKFSRLLSRHEMHGTTCVTVICGSTRWYRPAECDISVGVSLFAIAPNCLSLYYDVSTSDVMILGSKGVFRSFLGRRPNPIIDDSTSWGSFPQLDYESFRSLMVPAPKNLTADEIALQNGLVVKFADLWNDRVSSKTVSQILANEDDMTSLRMTSQTRNEVDQLQRWLRKQDIPVHNPLSTQRVDVMNATAIFQDIITQLRSMQTPSRTAQMRLRSAYDGNFRYFLREMEQKRAESQVRSMVIEDVSTRSRSRIQSASAMTPTATPLARSTFTRTPDAPQRYTGRYAAHPTQSNFTSPRASGMWYGPPPAYTFMNECSYPSPAFPTSVSTRHDPLPTPPHRREREATDLMYTPGFRKRRRSLAYCGECCICGSTEHVLAWLFQEPPSAHETVTPSFPEPDSHVPLNFPLAMGNYPEVDVIASAMCCERCSWFCVQQRISPSLSDGEIIAALPVVSFSENKEAYLNILEKVTARRFDRKCLAQVFMAMLISTVDAMEQSAVEGQEGMLSDEQSQNPDSAPLPASHATALALLTSAAEWTCINLMQSIVEHIELSESLATTGQPGYLPLDQVLDKQMAHAARDAQSAIIRYLIEGFPVLVRLVCLQNRSDKGAALLESVIVRRVLFALTESYVMMMATGRSESAKESSDGATDPNAILDSLLWTVEKRDSGQSEDDAASKDDAAGDASALAATLGESGHERVPVASISISALRDAGVLDEASYDTLSGMAAFRILLETPCEWTGPVIAVFLHTLVVVGAASSSLASEEPWSLFSKVVNHADIAAITDHPERIRETDARAMIDTVLAGGAQ